MNKESIEIKKHCWGCNRLDYLEQCDTCERELCLETISINTGKFQKGCLKVYHGSENLWCQDCYINSEITKDPRNKNE